MGQATKGQAIGTGIISGLKIAIGIAVIVLFKALLDVFYHMDTLTMNHVQEPSMTHFWIFGLPFIVPGIAGFFAAGFRNNVAYGIYMACCIISCVLDGIFCLMSFVWLFAMSAMGGMKCLMVEGQCICKSGDIIQGLDPVTPATIIGVDDCNDINKLVHMSYGAAALMILGWILCLTGSIISCSACCCGGRPSPPIVMMSSYPGQMTCVTTSHHQYPAAGYAPPPEQFPGDDVNEKNQYRYGRMN